HTRSYGDWSSDVCSSDLSRWWKQQQQDRLETRTRAYQAERGLGPMTLMRALRHVGLSDAAVPLAARLVLELDDDARARREHADEIGRASCRGRGVSMGRV